MCASCFAFGDSETICVCPISNFLDALLQLVLSSLYIFWSGSDAEVILNSRSETLCDAVYFYIEQFHWWNTPLGDSLFLLVEIRKDWSDSGLEFPVQVKTLYEVGQSALQPHAMQVFHYSEPPGSVISLIQIKEDCHKVLFLDVGPSYGGFQFDHIIDGWSQLSESTLRIGDKFMGLEKSDQYFVGHMLHCFQEQWLAGFEISIPGLGIRMIVAIFHDSGNLLFIQNIIIRR